MILYPKYFPVAGFTPLPNLMIIRYDLRNSKQLHIHEGVHQQQMRATGVLKFWFRYLFNPRWRQAYEIEAYKAQIQAGGNRDVCAVYLAGMYHLDITFDQAMELLK